MNKPKIKTIKKEYSEQIVKKMPSAMKADTAIGKNMIKDLQKLRLDTLQNLQFLVTKKK